MQRTTITAALLAASVTRRSSSPTPTRIRARWRAMRGRNRRAGGAGAEGTREQGLSRWHVPDCARG